MLSPHFDVPLVLSFVLISVDKVSNQSILRLSDKKMFILCFSDLLIPVTSLLCPLLAEAEVEVKVSYLLTSGTQPPIRSPKAQTQVLLLP